jgi:hypothetical protein
VRIRLGCSPSPALTMGLRSIFAVFNASFVPIIAFFYPETKGKTLEEASSGIMTLNATPGHGSGLAQKRRSC